MAKNTKPDADNGKEITHVLTEADFEKNPSLATEGLKVGDEIDYNPNPEEDEAALEKLADEIEAAESVEELDAINSDNEDIVALIADKKTKLEAAAETKKLEEEKLAEAAQAAFESMVDNQTLEQLQVFVDDLDAAVNVEDPIDKEAAKDYIKTKFNEAKTEAEKKEAEEKEKTSEKSKGTHVLKRGVLTGGRYYAAGFEFDKTHPQFKALKTYA